MTRLYLDCEFQHKLDCLIYICVFLSGSSGLEGHSKLSPNKSSSNLMIRTMSGPATSETSLSENRPMRLSEIHVAAEHALKQTISDPDFMTSLSSPEEFEVLYLFVHTS